MKTTTMSQSEKRVKSAKFVVKRSHPKVVKRRNARRMNQKKRLKSQTEVVTLTIMRPANAVVKREKRKRRNLKQNLLRLLQLSQVSQACQLLKRFATLSI